MKGTKPAKLLRAAVVALVLSAVFAGSAGASPVWKFNGTELSGTEKIVGAAVSSSLTIPGMTTTCGHFLYTVKISNSAGTGKGEVTELPLFECGTNTVCTVETITAEKFPWPAHLTTVASKNYLVIEGVRVSIKYGGKGCSVGGLTVPITGTAGGLLDNTTESATFSPTTFSATGTALKFGSNTVEWNGLFPTEAFEWHREQALSVS
ncbi:MAG TPA: hypothetical protein VN522_14330 [Solirubrobacterales bacterium]|nr:hypothetical protein [Solirubrobacterales bacterium]